MKLVAAAKLRRAQERIMSARPYAMKMAELLVEPGPPRGGRGASAAGARADAARKRLVIITADKGLCGAFNSNILRASLALPARAGRRRASRWWWWARRRATSTAGGRYDDQVARCSASSIASPTRTPRSSAGGLMQRLSRRRGGRGPPHLQRVPLGGGPAREARAAPAHRAAPGRGRRGEAAASTTSTSRAPRPSWPRSCRAT